MTISTAQTPELSVVIACYMEESHLVDSVSQLVETLDAMGRSYELIFIEDKSQDGTAALFTGRLGEDPVGEFLGGEGTGLGRLAAEDFPGEDLEGVAGTVVDEFLGRRGALETVFRG